MGRVRWGGAGDASGGRRGTRYPGRPDLVGRAHKGPQSQPQRQNGTATTRAATARIALCAGGLRVNARERPGTRTHTAGSTHTPQIVAIHAKHKQAGHTKTHKKQKHTQRRRQRFGQRRGNRLPSPCARGMEARSPPTPAAAQTSPANPRSSCSQANSAERRKESRVEGPCGRQHRWIDRGLKGSGSIDCKHREIESKAYVRACGPKRGRSTLGGSIGDRLISTTVGAHRSLFKCVANPRRAACTG